MKYLALVIALAACKDSKPAPAPTPTTPTPPVAADAAPAVLDVCGIAKAALDHAKCEQADVQANLAAAKKSIDGIIDTLRQLGSGNPQQFQVACGQLLLAIERDATKSKCQLALEPARRADIVQLLEAWYAQRTTVTQTGNPSADAVIVKIAAVRDAACACTTSTCLDSLGKQMQDVGAMPESAPQAARDLGSKLLEDAARCAARVRTLTDPK